jgi:hypothetical protein
LQTLEINLICGRGQYLKIMGFRKSRIRVCTKPTTVQIQNEEQQEGRIAFNTQLPMKIGD